MRAATLRYDGGRADPRTRGVLLRGAPLCCGGNTERGGNAVLSLREVPPTGLDDPTLASFIRGAERMVRP